jgi:drug/metabolite transporter (DMT)-like permease
MTLHDCVKNKLFCTTGIPVLAGLANLFFPISAIILIILVIAIIVIKIKKSASGQEKNIKIKRLIVYAASFLSFILTVSILDTYLDRQSRNIYYPLLYLIPLLVLLIGIQIGEKVGYYKKSKKRLVIIVLILLFFSSILCYKLINPTKDTPSLGPNLGRCNTIL